MTGSDTVTRDAQPSGAGQRKASQRNASQRNASQRNASQRNASQGDASQGDSGRKKSGPTGERGTKAHRVRWPSSLMLLVLLLVACAALGPVLSGSFWWWALLVVAGVVLGAAAGMRRAGVPGPLVPVMSTGVLVALLTLLFGGGSGLIWLIPTGETLSRFTELTAAGIRSIQSQGTPAVVLDGILFLLMVGVGVLAIVMDTLAIGLRWPALAGIPALVPILVPGFVLDDGADWTALVAAAAAYLVLLRVEVHLRGIPGRGTGPGVNSGSAVRGAVAIAALGIVGALVVSGAVPLRGDSAVGGLANRTLFGQGINPMVELGQDLRRPEAGPALHYRTTAEDPPYFALLTLDEIAGTTWLPRAAEVNRDNTVQVIDDPPGLSAKVARTTETTIIGIDNVMTDLLPVPVPATSVTGVTGQWFWNNDTRAITSTNTTTIGQRYTVTSLDVQPTREQLRESGGQYPVGVEPSLDLPEETPAIIEETALQVTAGSESDYDSAVALQDYLRGSSFSYDTDAPITEGDDVGGADVIATFLDEKRGYCVHFASAMALMSRALGIPSRITLGYLPGTRTSTVIDGLNRYTVDSHDLHAWPELYFVGVGWVPFEPTPGRGSVPDYARPEAATVPGGPVSGFVPPVAPNAAENPTLQTNAPQSAAEEEEVSTTLGRIGVVVAGLVLLMLVPGLVRKLRRLRRRTRLARGRAGATLAWREVADTARDHGVPVSDTVTARELAAEIRERRGVGDTPAASDALERLLVATERAHYAPVAAAAGTGSARSLADLDIVLNTVHRGSSAAERINAVLFPASLTAPLLRRMGLSKDVSTAPTP